MLTANYLDSLPDQILALYYEYETSVILDIARRLGKMSFESAVWQMQRLSESGALYEDILKKLSALTHKSETELKQIFQKTGVKALKFDDAIYEAAGLKPLPLNMSPAMAQVLASGLQKTNGILHNLTMTTAVEGQQAFIRAADLAYMQISTGAMSYNQAIVQAVQKVAAEGLSMINYAGGRRDQLDVAVRRTVLTGVSQTSAQLQLTRADKVGCDLVATSAHAGARPSHAVWQGRVFSRSGSSRDYPNFVEVTGYGTGAGLCGWNCRHSFYPFFKGLSENAYSKEELADFRNQTVEYNGKEISVYDATQEQRAIERKIRYWKRQAMALEAAGKPEAAQAANVKVKQWQGNMRDFIGQMNEKYEPKGIRWLRQPEREKVILLSKPKSKKSATIGEVVKSTDRKIIKIGSIGSNLESIFEVRTTARTVMATDDVLEHIEKHKDEFDIVHAKKMLPDILDNPKRLYKGKKKTSLQFIEDFDDRFFLLVPVKFLPDELWLETITIEEKKRFLRRWAKRELLYERK